MSEVEPTIEVPIETDESEIPAHMDLTILDQMLDEPITIAVGDPTEALGSNVGHETSAGVADDMVCDTEPSETSSDDGHPSQCTVPTDVTQTSPAGSEGIPMDSIDELHCYCNKYRASSRGGRSMFTCMSKKVHQDEDSEAKGWHIDEYDSD